MVTRSASSSCMTAGLKGASDFTSQSSGSLCPLYSWEALWVHPHSLIQLRDSKAEGPPHRHPASPQAPVAMSPTRLLSSLPCCPLSAFTRPNPARAPPICNCVGTGVLAFSLANPTPAPSLSISHCDVGKGGVITASLPSRRLPESKYVSMVSKASQAHRVHLS